MLLKGKDVGDNKQAKKEIVKIRKLASLNLCVELRVVVRWTVKGSNRKQASSLLSSYTPSFPSSLESF